MSAKSNPAVSGSQYRLAQAVLSGADKTGHMSKKVAKEIVERTPERMRSAYMRQARVNARHKTGPIETATRMVTGAGEYLLMPVKRFGEKADRGIGRVIGHNPKKVTKAQVDKAAKALEDAWWGKDNSVVQPAWDRWRSLHDQWKAQEEEKEWKNRERNPDPKFTTKSAAQQYARLIQHELTDGEQARVESSGGGWVVRTGWPVLKRNGNGKGKRKNPEAEAAEMYSAFHGKASESIATFEEEEAYHGHLAALGQLIELKVYTVTGLEATFCFEHEGQPEKGVILASNESGSSLYCVGGCQKLPLKDIKMDTDEWLKDSMIIGDCFFVSYYTEKDFDKWTPTIYEHTLGEETGDLPVLRYDRMNERIYLDGGAYCIKKPLFETSPGIEN